MSRLNIERDPLERLGADDMATVREQEFTALALANVQHQAAQAGPVTRGVCANCEAAIAPRLVYCCPECRDDHEHRLAAQKRGGR
jgi:hypothetical protein